MSKSRYDFDALMERIERGETNEADAAILQTRINQYNIRNITNQIHIRNLKRAAWDAISEARTIDEDEISDGLRDALQELAVASQYRWD